VIVRSRRSLLGTAAAVVALGMSKLPSKGAIARKAMQKLSPGKRFTDSRGQEYEYDANGTIHRINP